MRPATQTKRRNLHVQMETAPHRRLKTSQIPTTTQRQKEENVCKKNVRARLYTEGI
jgi:hypothetical protein